ncbi:hypothetical protein [Oscillatoria sp. FACHB-1406]|uniref:hypothetical protein n=1 Tax=Oscillatoria sp. FACHB-1406 TaxID=2692846 RepID=UPI0016859472|nr:hypothetical protein [Oscillatoria sp. FACHB-1406]MBD2577964.1 hypothetical protein [Oscillatoria sp. FACHB-1406]
MAALISPTVDLLLYDLRHESGQSLEDIQENRNLFIKKFPANFTSIDWEKDNRSEAEFVELLDERTQIENLQIASPEFQGYCYPVRIQEAYGLLLSCGVRDKYLPYSVAYSSKIKHILEQALQGQSGSLGQTWMISAYIEPFTYTQATALAKECYKSFMEGGSWEENLTSTSNFLGGKLFELWSFDPSLESLTEEMEVPKEVEKVNRSHHVIIAIYPSLEIASSATYFIAEWLRLFCYRHQVLWHYRQSRLLKELLVADRVDIQRYFENVGKGKANSSSLEQIEEKLEFIRAMFVDYSLDLNELQHKIAAMDLSLELYNQHSSALATSVAAENLSGDLAFLGQFATLARDRYLRFLQKDFETAKGGLELLELAIQLLRAEVSVSQAKGDRETARQNRTFQNTALILGTGIGSGIATATLAARGPAIEQKQIQATLATPAGQFMSKNLAIPPSWIVLSSAALLSLIVAAIASLVMGTIVAIRE